MPGLVAAIPDAPLLGHLLPLWSVVPFAAMLLCIAVLPLAAGKLWESNLNKAVLSAVLGVPVAIWTATLDPTAVVHAASEYVAFIVLLGALFVISGGIVVRGTLAGTPGLNTVLLGIGAVLASIIGTTGASMLLVRPLLRANSVRWRQAHVFVFFFFIVAYAAACSVAPLLFPRSSRPLALTASPPLLPAPLPPASLPPPRAPLPPPLSSGSPLPPRPRPPSPSLLPSSLSAAPHRPVSHQSH